MAHPLAFPDLLQQSHRSTRATTIVLVLGLGLLVLIGAAIARKIDDLGASSIDNIQWTISQLDVELLTLQIALEDAHHGFAPLSEVRKRFDIAYSRFRTLQAGRLFVPLRDDPGFDAAITALSGFLNRATPLIDGPDADLFRALRPMKRELAALTPQAHRLGTLGVEIFAAEADANRAGIKALMAGLTLLSAALFMLLLGMLYYLDRISARARAQAAEAAATATRLDAVIGASLDPVITLDEAGRIAGFSPAATRTFGHEAETLRGQGLDLLLPDESLETALAASGRRRVTARRADGGRFPAEISVSQVEAAGRRMAVVFLSDLSAQVAAERAMMAARDAALAGEKAKAELLVVMSHELRTPLNGMVGTLDLLAATPLAGRQRDYLRIMADSAQLLMSHVNNILDMARLDSGRATLRLAPTDLAALIEEVAENQRPASTAHGNLLTVEILCPEATHVMADAGRLKQVLLNLLGNAVKFTRGGRITLSLTRGPEGHVFAVEDTGIGIAPEDLDRIFEDFVTLDPSFARNAAGTGLGLGIVRRLVSQMGGVIRVESTPDEGSRFALCLPLAPATQPPGRARALSPPVRPLPAPTAESRRLLVIEDNDFNRLIVREMLKQDGHTVVEAADGTEGLEAAQQEVFDLILMDISMPGIDGLTATERLRQDPGPNRETPVLALTAHAMPEDIRRFLAAGMQDVLLKPVQIETLRAALSRHGRPAAPPTSPAPLMDETTWAEMGRTLSPAVRETLLTRFLADMTAGLARLMAEEDPIALRKEAHHMAGSAGVFGARAFGVALEHLLSGLRQDPPLTRGKPALAALWAETEEAYRRAASSSRAQASSLR
jgi:PAS domain S-box-containing protein